MSGAASEPDLAYELGLTSFFKLAKIVDVANVKLLTGKKKYIT